ncbi:MAG TPA: MXAN_5808 family serine peptidase [Myxococcota bacterium]|nr:MXAN_5808 family serine peptidase [Myxococcota bacterium]
MHRPSLASARLRFALVALVLSLVVPAVWPWPSVPAAQAKTDRTGLYDLSKARLLARVVGHVRAHYVAPERIAPRRMIVAALERVQGEVPEVRVAVPGGGPAEPALVQVSVGDLTRDFDLGKVGDLYELNWKLMEIFEFLERHLPPQVDLESLEYAAVNGLLSTLDPHTILLSPRVYRELQLSQKGRFGGLGISVGDVDGQLVIQQVMRDTPAAEVGLEVDDRIVQIGGVSTIGMALDEAVNLLRGEPGSEVTLWIARPPATDAKPFKIVRREIQLPSVEAEHLGDGIGWLYIRSFQENTDQDLITALEQLDRQMGGLKGLVLDMRDNPGGLLDKAVAVSDAFLPSGTIVTTVRDAGRERDESHATLGETRSRLPLIVLVNRQSASASEIVAGALKRNDRALVVGQRTFGKGSVQVVYRIDEAALKLTVAQYLTPGDVSIQGVGIVPDIDLVTLKLPELAGKAATFDGRMDLRPIPETAGGEQSLSSHLSSDRTRDDKPSVTLRLLDDSRTPTHRQRKGQGRTLDATVRLAKDMLSLAPAADRKQALVQLAAFFPKRQQEEDTRLQQALAPLEVDWRDGPRPGAAKGALEVSAKFIGLEPGPQGEAPLTAGQAVTLEVSAKNTSRRPIPRLHAELESTVPGLQGRELVFGWLEPGARATRKVTLTPPPGVGRMGDRVTVRLYSDGEPLAPSAALLVAVSPRPNPAFAHSVAVLDDIAPANNGNGLVQRGERLFLEAWITNVGTGQAESVLATLKNESGPDVFLHLGRQELGAIAPGESRRARFELEVKPSMKARLVELSLELVDTSTGLSTGTRPVELPIFPSELPSRSPKAGVAVFPNVQTALMSGASRDTRPLGEVQPAAVLDVVGEAGDWVAVRFQDTHGDRLGWIPRERVRLAESGGITKDAVTPTDQHRPVIVTLDDIPAFISGPDLPLRGVARFAGDGKERRLIYIFRERDKVFFRSGEGEGSGPSGVPGRTGPGIPETGFSAVLPLTSGRNEVTVIAREGDHNATRVTFTVFRLD